ncbi:MAG TPA: hypothetical protein VHH53_14560 [Pseudonocardiaceae bacterium]|nr:hypothetical protein [Pseudonocardiaceae bacterium]
MDGDRRPGRHDAGEATPQTALRVAKPTRVRLAWALGALAVIVVVATLLLILQARGAQLPPGFRTAGIVETLQFLGPAIVGAVLAARRPANPIGWLLLGLGLCFALYPLVVMYVTTALVVVPGGLPGVRWVAWVGNWIWVPAHGCIALLFLLFPNGRLLSPRWRPVAWSALGAAAVLAIAAACYPGPLEVGRLTPDTEVLPGFDNPLGVAAFGPSLPVMLVVIQAVAVLGIVSLALRFRRSRGEERQQLKWVAYAGLFYGLQTVVLVVGNASGLLSQEGMPWLDVLDYATAFGLLLAIAVAVLKYRLYDIDRIINRTLVYGLLTAALGLCYVAGSLLFVLVAGASADPPSWLVAATTLAAAAVFRPARRRIQATVDRRFNRRRYHAARTIEAFSARLRDEVDLDTLSAELLAVVDRTMEPTRASLWLRPPMERSGHAIDAYASIR